MDFSFSTPAVNGTIIDRIIYRRLPQEMLKTQNKVRDTLSAKFVSLQNVVEMYFLD